MINYDIVIPTFGRPQHLEETLNSLLYQDFKPSNIFIIDNNTDHCVRAQVQLVLDQFKLLLPITYTINIINSGSVARNLGASLSVSELIAFLDDDVILEPSYYLNLVLLFDDPSVLGAQGVDTNLIKEFSRRKNSNIFEKLLLLFENVFETSSTFSANSAKVRPSLAVEHPDIRFDFSIQSQWISTCAGIFRRKVFESVQFPENFVKYSWNEYLYFSYMIFKNRLGVQYYVSNAKYQNIQTNNGRLPSEELIYMAEVYDFFVFKNLFDTNFYNLAIFIKSRIGRFLYSLARILSGKKGSISNLFTLLKAWRMVILNMKNISKGNFDCYNDKFNTFVS